MLRPSRHDLRIRQLLRQVASEPFPVLELYGHNMYICSVLCPRCVLFHPIPEAITHPDDYAMQVSSNLFMPFKDGPGCERREDLLRSGAEGVPYGLS